MSRWVRLGLVAAVAVGLSSLPACGNKGSSSRVKVAVVTNCTAEFWSICEAGATKAAREQDVDLDFRQPKTNAVADQQEVIDAVTKIGVAGIAVSVIEPNEQAQYLRRIAAKQTLIAMDNDSPASDRKYYVGIDNYEAGKAVGRMVKKAMPDGGTVILFIGNTASANSRARIGGVLDELAGQRDAKGPQLGKFTYHGNTPLVDDTDEAKAQQNAKAVIEELKNTPNVALIGLYAYNPKQILLAYRSKRSEVKHPMKIFGFDEDWTTLAGVAGGEIEGTVVQNPFLYGYNSVKILSTLAKGGSIPAAEEKPLTVIPYRLVTRDGGPTEEVNGISVLNLKAAEFEQQLRADIDSVKK
jgi:ribose transport system substrate-binding protein